MLNIMARDQLNFVSVCAAENEDFDWFQSISFSDENVFRCFQLFSFSAENTTVFGRKCAS